MTSKNLEDSFSSPKKRATQKGAGKQMELSTWKYVSNNETELNENRINFKATCALESLLKRAEKICCQKDWTQKSILKLNVHPFIDDFNAHILKTFLGAVAGMHEMHLKASKQDPEKPFCYRQPEI